MVSGEAPVPSPGAGDRAARAQAILGQCWPVVADTLLPRLSQVLQEALAAAARSDDEAVVRAASTLSAAERLIVQSYGAALRTEFTVSVERFVGRKPNTPLRRPTLSLQDMDESDQRSQVDQVTARLRNLVQVPQAGLLAKLQPLWRGGDLPEAQSPLRPGIFLHAMADSIAPHLGTPGLVGAVLRHVAVPLAPALEATFVAVGRYLDSQGITPAPLPRLGSGTRADSVDILLTLAETMPAPLEKDGRPPPLRHVPAAAPGLPPREAEPEDEPYLADYVRLQAQLGINANVLLEVAQAAATRGAAPTQAPVPLPEELNAFLLSAQRRDAARVAAYNDEMVGAPRAPDAADGAAPVATDAGVNAALGEMIGTRDHSRRLIALAGTPLQKLTIQLVARIFARIERDRLVPDPIRTLLVCLRFALLEVALADPAVLLRPNHPARRLMDAIAASAIGWSPDTADNRRYLRHARAAVHFVVHSPGSAASAFEQSREQFAAFLAAIVPSPSESLAAAKDALREVERREMQAQVVARFIDQVLQGATLEDHLRQFLLVIWSRVLAAGAARSAEEPELFGRLCAVVPDLVASVQPPAPGSDRRRLVETIGSLLGRLRDGVALVGWPQDKLQAFLNRLMIAHSQVITGADQAAAGSWSASTVRIRFDGFRLSEPADGDRGEGPVPILEEGVPHLLQQRGSPVIHQWLRNPPQLPPDAPDEPAAQCDVDGWRERTWFDMRLGRSLVRMRLAWWTPRRSLALFASRSGGSMISLSHAALVSYRRFGWITPTEALPLVSRAFRGVVGDLQRASRAAADSSERAADGADGSPDAV